jgi:hypothetical protein
MINIIVFSKNRACQLDLLLRSMKDKFKIEHNLTILYTLSDIQIEKGYEILKRVYSEIKFVKENNFKQNLLDLISLEYKYTLCLTDDCFFIAEVQKDDIFKVFDEDEKNILALSLLRSRNNKYIYDNSSELSYSPEFLENNTWKWRKTKFKIWKYSMGVATNIYRTKDLLNCISKLNFRHPNTLESAMIKNPINKPLMIGFNEIKVVEFDVNKVNKVQYNNLQESVKFFNNQWLNNMRIKKGPLKNLRKDLYMFRNINFEFEQR